jgi:hypothetical protein
MNGMWSAKLKVPSRVHPKAGSTGSALLIRATRSLTHPRFASRDRMAPAGLPSTLVQWAAETQCSIG